MGVGQDLGGATGSTRNLSVLLGEVVRPRDVVEDGAVVLAGERIAYVGPRRDLPAGLAGDTVALPSGARLLPGLVDLHCHGGGGGEFGPERASALRAAEHHLAAGTTSVVASLVSAPPDTLVEGMRTCRALATDGLVAAVHVEGPFLAASRCGAQDPAALSSVDLGLVSALTEAGQGCWGTMTYAPELDEDAALVSALASAGVVPAVGHTDADARATRRALGVAADALGTRPPLVTHLFNAMPPLHHRVPGPVASCLSAAARGEAVVELVADGVHLADETVRLVFDVAAPGAVALVTDAMAAAGMPDGRYVLGRLDVVVADGTARLARGGAIAGGTSVLLDVVRQCVQQAGVPLVDAVRAASITPAAVLGIDDRVGALTSGLRADVLAVDAALRPVAVWHAGRRLRPPTVPQA